MQGLCVDKKHCSGFQHDCAQVIYWFAVLGKWGLLSHAGWLFLTAGAQMESTLTHPRVSPKGTKSEMLSALPPCALIPVHVRVAGLAFTVGDSFL